MIPKWKTWDLFKGWRKQPPVNQQEVPNQPVRDTSPINYSKKFPGGSKVLREMGPSAMSDAFRPDAFRSGARHPDAIRTKRKQPPAHHEQEYSLQPIRRPSHTTNTTRRRPNRELELARPHGTSKQPPELFDPEVRKFLLLLRCLDDSDPHSRAAQICPKCREQIVLQYVETASTQAWGREREEWDDYAHGAGRRYKRPKWTPLDAKLKAVCPFMRKKTVWGLNSRKQRFPGPPQPTSNELEITKRPREWEAIVEGWMTFLPGSRGLRTLLWYASSGSYTLTDLYRNRDIATFAHWVDALLRVPSCEECPVYRLRGPSNGPWRVTREEDPIMFAKALMLTIRNRLVPELRHFLDDNPTMVSQLCLRYEPQRFGSLDLLGGYGRSMTPRKFIQNQISELGERFNLVRRRGWFDVLIDKGRKEAKLCERAVNGRKRRYSVRLPS